MEEMKKGRPPAEWTIGKEMTQVGFRVDSELWQNFKIACIETKISASEQVNILIESHLKRAFGRR